MAVNDERLELPGRLEKGGDYTYYLPRDDKPPESYSFRDYHALLESRRFAGHSFSAACSGKVFSPEYDRRKTYIDGRLLICRCYRGREIAVTLRELNREVPDDAHARESDPCWDRGACKYAKAPKPGTIPFPVPIERIAREVDGLAIGSDSHATGLILITGSTNSAKSELTRGLIARILQRQVEDYRKKARRRRPHLLTFEDPIEKWLFQRRGAEATSLLALESGVEYTPREKGVDVGSLKEAIDDALRQTPSIFYIGEVREDQDWAEVMRFAGTGHLVIATAHAGSLIEAMERIFRGVGAETPAARGQIAQRIRAVVHQLKFNLTDLMPELPVPFDVLMPAVWRNTSAGVAALVSDGLSSVLPNTPSRDVLETTSSFGRRFFAQKLDKGHWADILKGAYLLRDARPGLEKLEDDLSAWAAKELDDRSGKGLVTRVLNLLEEAFKGFRAAEISGWAEGRGLAEAFRTERLHETLGDPPNAKLAALADKVRARITVPPFHSDPYPWIAWHLEAARLAADASTLFEMEAIRRDLMGE